MEQLEKVKKTCDIVRVTNSKRIVGLHNKGYPILNDIASKLGRVGRLIIQLNRVYDNPLCKQSIPIPNPINL